MSVPFWHHQCAASNVLENELALENVVQFCALNFLLTLSIFWVLFACSSQQSWKIHILIGIQLIQLFLPVIHKDFACCFLEASKKWTFFVVTLLAFVFVKNEWNFFCFALTNISTVSVDLFISVIDFATCAFWQFSRIVLTSTIKQSAWKNLQPTLTLCTTAVELCSVCNELPMAEVHNCTFSQPWPLSCFDFNGICCKILKTLQQNWIILKKFHFKFHVVLVVLTGLLCSKFFTCTFAVCIAKILCMLIWFSFDFLVSTDQKLGLKEALLMFANKLTHFSLPSSKLPALSRPSADPNQPAMQHQDN